MACACCNICCDGGSPLPTTLTASISATNCACLDGQTFTLTLDGGNCGGTDCCYSGSINAGTGCEIQELKVTIGSTSATGELSFGACFPAGQVTLTQVSFQCDPLQIVFESPTTNPTGCCNHPAPTPNVTLTFTVTE